MPHTRKPDPLPRHLEPVVNDMAGVASIAAAILSIVRTDHEAADSLAIKEGLGWLEVRLNAAAENLLAVQERRAPRWNTTMDADMIADALAAIPHGGEDAQ